MRARLSAPPSSAASRVARLMVSLLAVAVLGTWPAAKPAQAADPRLEKAQAEQQARQEALDAVLAKIEALEVEVDTLTTQLAALTAQQQAEQAQADAAAESLARRVRQSYKRGAGDPMLSLFGSGSVGEATEQARMLAVLARNDERDREVAVAARTRTQATAELVQAQADQLAAHRQELAQAKEAAAVQVAEAEKQVASVRALIAAEEAARERARRAREARAAAASRGAAGASLSAASVGAGGVACPVGNPRSYSDTWGAARSGGRSHKGTDILAPRGTSIHAYENGTITRMHGNRLGGISLYLRGVSGNEYYYTHLQGYAGGVSPGSTVRAGQQIAYNGDTGNARGIPHLHFEVRPGGGGTVNPYPYVRRACG